VLSLPIMLYQLWSFIAPGLYSREKRLAVPFVGSSCLLFAAGGYFCWRLVFPMAFQYLLGFAGPVGPLQVTPTVMIDEYIDFCMRMLIAFGVVFELPVLVTFLSLAGLVTHRHLIRFARYFVVIAFVIAAVITPPDIVSQFLLAIPLCLLYAISIGIAWLFTRGREKKAQSAE
jgi:sec-independent protein translocase protein TatC